MHRDIKPDNFLLTVDDTVKLTDFGLSRLLNTNERPPEKPRRLTGETGAYRYMSPECQSSSNYGVLSDVYSVSIIIYELFEGQMRLRRQDGKIVSQPQMIAQCAAEGIRPAFAKLQGSNKLRSRLIRDAISAAWALHPEERINACQLLARLEETEQTPTNALDPNIPSGPTSQGSTGTVKQKRGTCCAQQ